MKRILVFVLPLIVLSCGGNDEVEHPTPPADLFDNDSSVIRIDTVKYVQDTTTIFNGLADFFSVPMCQRIRKLNSDFNRYTTNEEFDQILNDAGLLLDFLELDMYSTKTRFKMEMKQEYGAPETMSLIAAVDQYADSLLPIVIECGAECVSAAFFIDFESIKKPIRLSPSEADDDLVEILRRVYGVYGDFRFQNTLGWKEWWVDDFFLYAFGNDYMYDSFTMICRFEEDHPGQFVERIAKIKNELVDNLEIEEDEHTLYSLDTITEEFNAILDLECLSAEQKKKIQGFIKAMNTAENIHFESDDY